MKMRFQALLFTALVAATPAGAAMIGFEGAQPGLNGELIVEGDYRITAFSSMAVHTSSGSNALFGPNPFDFSRPTSMTLSRNDGGAFDLLSLDVFSADSNGLGVPVSYVARYADGSTSRHTVELPKFASGTPILNTRVALTMPDAFRNVVGVSWSNGAVWHQTDNIVVEAATAAVPEPTSWTLMIGGFGLAGAALRRAKAGEQRLHA